MGQHSTLPGQPPSMGQQTTMPGQPPAIMGQQTMIGQQTTMVGQQPAMVGQQPTMVGQRSAIPGQHPAMIGQQPGQHPSLPGQPGPSNTSSSEQTQRNHLAKWEADEPLGDQSTIAMILYANINHHSLKMEHPNWSDRIKQIAKIWKNLPNEKRAPYVQRARENRTANRLNKTPVSFYYGLTFT